VTAAAPWAAAVGALLLRAAFYAGGLGGAGLAFFALLFGARLEAADAVRLRRWAAGACLLGLSAASGGLAAQVWALTGGETLRDAEVWALVLRSRAGASHALGVAGLLLVALFAAGPGAAVRARRPAVAAAAAAGGVLVCASHALLGHTAGAAGGGGTRLLLAGLLVIHLLGAAFWVGSLPPLAWAARREGTAAARLVLDWARLAAFAVPVLLAAGVLLAVLVGGGARGLLGSRYGSVLAAKALLASVLLGLAAWHRFRLTPALAAGAPGAGRRLARSVAVEAVVALFVLLAAAALVATPPP
jgi:putative copper export protein